MRVLILHNYYQQPGGEDVVFSNEARLLEQHGHTVIRYQMHNDGVRQLNAVSLAAKTLWNRSSYSEIRELIRRHAVDVCHCHNTFPLISPSAYYAARDEHVPVVQTLHNYRLLCPKGVLYREGRVCEECVGAAVPWRAVSYACYRDSRTATAAAASMLAVHRAAGTWRDLVDAYIALTEFCRDKFVDAGLPARRVHVKPNFLMDDPGADQGREGFALFAGRLTEEKGIRTLLRAWSALPSSIVLNIAGSGPLAPEVERVASTHPHIRYLGAVPRDRMNALMGDAAALIFPSEWYEAGPMTIIEAFARGTPVIASRLGSGGSLVADGRTGFHFTAGNPESLASVVRSAWASPELLPSLRAAARAEFERKYTAARNYHRLLELYGFAGAREAGAAYWS